MKGFWIKKIIGWTICATAMVFLASYIIMVLWNNVLTGVIAVKSITYLQSLGIFILSKLLFGGFGRSFGKRCNYNKGMKEKWQNMTQEEREQFKKEWRQRCQTWRSKKD